MKVPHVIECFVRRCQNYHCVSNQNGACRYGVDFHVYNCSEYNLEKEPQK